MYFVYNEKLLREIIKIGENGRNYASIQEYKMYVPEIVHTPCSISKCHTSIL